MSRSMFPLPLKFQKCPTRRGDDVLPPVPKTHLYLDMSSFVWRLCYILKMDRFIKDVEKLKKCLIWAYVFLLEIQNPHSYLLWQVSTAGLVRCTKSMSLSPMWCETKIAEITRLCPLSLSLQNLPRFDSMSSFVLNKKSLVEKWSEVDTCVGDFENMV
jgi:hypothetical protein